MYLTRLLAVRGRVQCLSTLLAPALVQCSMATITVLAPGEIATAAGIGQSSFFHVFPSKEALLLELVKRMFGGQFDLAGQHSDAEDPVFLYAVETALQLHIAELTEPLRELYVMAYSLPTTTDYLYHSTAKRLQTIFAAYLPRKKAGTVYDLPILVGILCAGGQLPAPPRTALHWGRPPALGASTWSSAATPTADRWCCLCWGVCSAEIWACFPPTSMGCAARTASPWP